MIPFKDITFYHSKKRKGLDSSVIYSKLNNDSTKYAAKIFHNDISDENYQKYIQILTDMKHSGLIPFKGFCSDSKLDLHQNILLFKYANLSLQHVFNLPKEKTPWFDFTRQFILIYGIAITMKFLHENSIIHGRLTPSNILLDDNYEPQISDYHFSIIQSKLDVSIKKLVDSNLYYYIDPYTLKTGKVCDKSDIYAFAIITLQILSGTTQIFEENDAEKLLNKIKTESLMPMIPRNFPNNIKDLLINCLNEDPNDRISFNEICERLDQIIPSLFGIQQDLFNQYKARINSSIEENIQKATINQIEDLDDSDFNFSESDKASSQNSNDTDSDSYQIDRQNYDDDDSDSYNVNTNNNDDDDNFDINNDDEAGNTNKNTNEFIPLIDDPYFDKPAINLNDTFNNIEKKINNNEEFFSDMIEEIEKLNFIFTADARERLQKIANFLKVNVPVLLEGPTGTSKTLSSEIVCKALHYDLIRFNLSSETKTQDLIGRYVGDENSWAGITMKDGPFYEAFSKGKVLLLDEINLAPPSVLQCIEESLDSGFLSVEIPGRPLKVIKKNKNFRLIATQNPNKGLFANKRQNLGLKFYSRFKVISFPSFSIEELKEIGLKLAEKFKYNNPTVVKELVDFHKEWSDEREKTEDPQCFTIREIAATVHALSKKENIYDTIMTIYGARYKNKLKEKLKNTLKKYTHLFVKPKDEEDPNFPGCHMTKSLRSAAKSISFSFKNHRHVLLTGKPGCGKTQLAIWSSEFYNEGLKNNSSNEDDESFFCVCTEEIKVADLVGHSTPSGKSDGTSELIVWQDGFLTKAIKKGKCCVLESLDEAPPTVTERLNGILDQKYDNQEQFFDNPESTSCPRISINENFRILATCSIDKLSKMSPALLNRFDVIVLEDQITDKTTQAEFTDLIKKLLDKYSTSLFINTKVTEQSKEEEDEDDDNGNEEFDKLFHFQSDDDDDEEEEEDKNEKTNNNNNKDTEIENNYTFNYHEEIIQMIYEKITSIKNISFISKMCKSVIKLSSSFQNNHKIRNQQIVDFAFLLLQNNSKFVIVEQIEEELINMLHPIHINNDAPFFYKQSPALKQFFAKLMAYSIIEQPVCITGPTGVGKTASSRAFSMMRPCRSKDPFGFQFHSFHSTTKVSHFFGTTVISDGNIQFHDGTLTTALKKGIIFIADEFNLSTQPVMKSLALALDPTVGRKVYIPGTGQMIKISPEFFFIACQNELGTLGRNAIPESILQRFVEIDYPKPKLDEIKNICVEIAKDNFPQKSLEKFKDTKLAEGIANFMIKLNELKLIDIPPWSLRDITKLFKRIYNEKNNRKFIGLTSIHHILFYTLSAVPPNNVDNIIEKINNIMLISFDLKENELNELISCYKSTPKFVDKENQGLYLMKGDDFGISINNVRKILYDKELPSLWNSFIKVSLADDREPILLMGNSGFKTFLANQLSPLAKIISLNQETTVPQLIGKSAFMKVKESKLFYIEYICRITQNEPKIKELSEKWLNKQSISAEIDEIINEGKQLNVPKSFWHALDHLREKLFSDLNTRNKESILSDTVLEFRPGLFLDAILQRQSLILKDLSNLPTIVLERFNELFSGKQNLTLSEDIHNTFTSDDSKELTDFNDTFRVFATCSSYSVTRLSEAVLSRFSVIYIPEYSSDEQEIVLGGNINYKNLFNPNDIKNLKDFVQLFKDKFKRSISFPQMIKIIDLTSKINKETSIDEQNHNISIALYRFLGGLFESNKNRKELIDLIDVKFSLPKNYSQINNRSGFDEESSLQIYESDKEDDSENKKYYTNGILSKMSNLFLKSSIIHKPKTEVSFTPSFNDLLDLIHFGLTIHNPIILEGSPGQGKHAAINYIAELLDINVVQITISQSTKVEDLFGKETIDRDNNGIRVKMVDTDFVKIIKASNNDSKRSLIILENINNSSPAILNALVPVFNTHSSNIFLPNGKTINRGQFDIIAIFNTRQVSSSKDKLPSSLINSSIYHIVSKPNEEEVLSIILTKFAEVGLNVNEAFYFNIAFQKAKSMFSNEGSSSDLFTLNDVQKYILFRTLTEDCFDKDTILQMIFAYRFSNSESISKMIKLLDLEEMKFVPIFDYNVPPTELFIRISNKLGKDDDNKSKKILSLPSKNKDTTLISKIETLTLHQKHCLVFLAISLLAKRASVIQGDTASGKSFIIRLFAELLGKKLIVFQMNSDSNISMLVGQSILNDEISDEDKEKFREAFTALSEVNLINLYFKDKNNNIDIKDDTTWNPKEIKKLLNFIKTNENTIKEKNTWEKVEKAILTIKEKMNPVNRFQRKKSEFVNAMLNGYWVLIDGIESAPSAIAEKISSLCSEKPLLNLYEYGSEFLFSTESKKNRIHEDFHLFITYNPHAMKETQMIDQSFLDKSVSFSLPTIDGKIENLPTDGKIDNSLITESIKNPAQILFGSFINLSYQKELAKELASRIALVHYTTKIESILHPDNFAGETPFHGRIFTFIIKAFNLYKKETDVAVPTCFSINSFYADSCSSKKLAKSLRSKCVEVFKQKPDNELLNSLQTSDMSFRERNEFALVRLRNIQQNVIQNKNFSYSLSQLMEDFLSIRISDIDFVQKHIKSTIKMITSKSTSTDDLKTNPVIKYGSLCIIRSIFSDILSLESEIKQEHSFLSIKDKELRNEESIASPLAKFDLLGELLKEKLIREDSSLLLVNEDYQEIISNIVMIMLNQQKSSIISLFRIIEQNNNMIHFIDEIFPYKHFANADLCLINNWILLTKQVIEKKIHFIFAFNNDEKIELNYSSPYNFVINLCLNEENKLEIIKGSEIKFTNNKNNVSLPTGQDKLIYNMLIDISEKPFGNLTKKQFQKAFKSFYDEAIKKEKDAEITNNNIKVLSQLFLDDNNNNSNLMIKMIWKLVFTLSENEIQEISKIVNPIESRLLLSALKMINSVDQKNIIKIVEWSKWAINLDKYTESVLKCILKLNDPEDQINKANIDSLIDKIKFEKGYLQRSPDKENLFWNSKELIDYCDDELNRLSELKAKFDNATNEMKIKKQFIELAKSLNNKKINEKYLDMKKEIIFILKNIKEFTENNFKAARKKVNQFINYATANTNYEEKAYINWPFTESLSFSEKSTSNSQNINLFESLIWYTKIDTLLTNIKGNKDMMLNIIKLGDFNEMIYPRELLLAHLIQNAKEDASSLTLQDHNEARYTLEANMILKLRDANHNYITRANYISDTINNYANRDSHDEREIQWIYQAIKDYSPDFTLVIPTFKPNALVFLIVNKSKDEKYFPGPLFLDAKIENTFYQSLSILMHQRFASFRDAAGSIAETIYSTFEEKADSNPLEDYDSLRNYFFGLSKATTKRFQIVNKIKLIFQLAEYLDGWKQSDLEFKDTFFLSKENKVKQLYKNENLLNQYPSFLFWICKNKPCIKQIKKTYGDKYIPNPKEIPLWILCLRILSSKQCIKFETNSHSAIANIINKATTNTFMSYLEESRKRKESINNNWINLLISNAPEEIANNNIKIIHDYLYLLSLDDLNNQSELIKKIKYDYINESVSQITSLVLSNQSDELITKSVKETNSLIKFLSYPLQSLQEKIDKCLLNTAHSILDDKSVIHLRNILSNKDILEDIYTNLTNAIKEDDEEFKFSYLKAKKLEYEKQRNMTITSLQQKINEYNEIVLNYKEINLTYKNLTENINRLKDLERDLMVYPILFKYGKDEGINVGNIKYKTSVTITRKYEGKTKVIEKKNKHKNEQFQYLLPCDYIDNKHRYGVTVNYHFFKYIKEEYGNSSPNVANLIQTEATYLQRIPVIVFGDHYTLSKTFTCYIKELKDSLNSFDIEFFNILDEDKHIDYCVFSFVKKNLDLVSKIKENLQVKFSNGAIAPRSNDVVQGDLKTFLDILHPLLKNLSSLVDNNLYPIWKDLDSRHQMSKLFNYDYDIIEVTNENHYHKSPDFSSLTDINSLASPIFYKSLSNEIVCSVKRLKYQLRPIFPTLLSNRPISINFISFIDGEITASTKLDTNYEQYSKLISTKEKISNKEPIQMFIRPPKITENEDVLIEIKGNLLIQASGTQQYQFPFEISLVLLPMKVRIRCPKYQLEEINNNTFKLCCDKIGSGGAFDFELINYYVHDQFISVVELEALENNQSDSPSKKIDKSNKSVSLTMPTVDKSTRCQFDTIIKLSKNLEYRVICDFQILPFTYYFEAYDYTKKEFISDVCQIITQPCFKQKLYFRMIFPYPIKQRGNIKLRLPYEIKVLNSDIDLKYQFDINDDLLFSIDIENPKFQIYVNRYYKYEIILEIGNIKKSIAFDFISPNNIKFNPLINDDKNGIYLKTFPCYCYNYDGDNNWVRIRNNRELNESKNSNKPTIVVTPFEFYSNINDFTLLDYKKNYSSLNVVNKAKSIIKYVKMTLNNKSEQKIIIDETVERATDSIIEEGKYWNKTINITHCSIIGFIENDPNKWFPVFDDYPYIQDLNQLPYNDDPDNVKIANSNIKIMFDRLKTNKKDVIDVFSSKYSSHVKQKNSAILITLLLENDIIFNIDSFVNNLPPIIQEKFNIIRPDIKPYVELGNILSPGMIKIISHNLILFFLQIFKEKYEEISSHQFCLQFPCSADQINNQINKAKLELLRFDESKALVINNKNINISDDEHKDDDEENKDDHKQISHCFIIGENENPRKCSSSDPLGSLPLTENYDAESDISKSADTISSLPSISLLDNSLSGYNLFFLSCAQGASVLPAYVRSCRINQQPQNDSEKYFVELLNLYTTLTAASSSNKSILSDSINRFIDSFKNCVKRLKHAGANFEEIKLPPSLNSNSNYSQSFIWIPDDDLPVLFQIPWKINNRFLNNITSYDDEPFEPSKMHIEQGDKHKSKELSENPDKPESDAPQSQQGSSKPKISKEEKKVTINKFFLSQQKAKKDDDKDKDEEEEEEENEEEIVFHPGDGQNQSTDVDPNKFKSMSENINDIDILKYILIRISSLDENCELELSDNTDSTKYEIQGEKELFECDKQVFPVKELVDNSRYLTMRLISGLSDSNCPFLSMSCNLLIDCSKIISNQNKLYNFVLLSSFSYALASLEIPFTISLIADQHFRFVLKPYNEDISTKVLQRVLDCLLIKRYRANIADTFKYAIDMLKHPERKQRAFFIFSDGLDENLVLAKSWKEKILNDSNNSFGLIFSKAKLPDDSNYDIVEKMWENFKKSVENAKSKTILTYIKPEYTQEIIISIVQTFVDVLSRSETANEQNDANAPKEKKNSYIKPIFDIKAVSVDTNYSKELSKDSFARVSKYFNYNLVVDESSIFKATNAVDMTSAIQFEKLDVQYYKEKTAKIMSSTLSSSIKDNFDHIIHNSLFSRRNSSRPQLESIFLPNKASQTVLSSTGTDFDITALILNLLNPVPDPLIYLEEKGGLIRNYGVSIIIDSSMSCFNQFSAIHSYQTLKVLFSALASIEIPCIDVIIATDGAPIVLGSEMPSKRIFNEKSPFWPSLFNILSRRSSYACNLESAMHAACDIRRMRSVDSTSYMFVLTDGLYQKDQKELIQSHIATCIQNGISIFGIGIGIYPIGIKDMFPQVIFTTDPNYLIQGIASFFGDEPGDLFDPIIKVLLPDIINANKIDSIRDDLIAKENEPIFSDLKNYLSQTFIGIDAFSHVYNSEKAADAVNLFNLKNEGTEMYVKDLFKGQKILIVMPYDASMNLDENPKLLKENLLNENDEKETCVKKAVEHYGIEIEVVQNYKDAINKLTRQNADGKCDYYAMWIISGLPYNMELADGGSQHLVLQFIQCAIQFWEKGGAIVLLAEGEPLTFQANLFLKEVTFPGNVKTKLQLKGSHEGKKILEPDETGILDKPGTFNRSKNEFKKFQRAPIGHNIFHIYEGETISYVSDDKSEYFPFVPFMRDTEGGICALFYPGDRDSAHKRGDIVIDTGYSKLFDKMTTEGTFKFVQNIAAWTAQYESRSLLMEKAESFHPDAINFTINESVEYKGFEPTPAHLLNSDAASANFDPSLIEKRLFAIDYSGSVSGATLYHQNLRQIFDTYYKDGDTIIIWDSTYEIISKSRMDSIISCQGGRGGTDPHYIAQACVDHPNIPRQHLILVTDGYVSSSSVAKGDTIIQNNGIQFQYVTAYIVGSDNLSVVAPFARGCGSTIHQITSNSRKEISSSSQSDFSVLQRIDRISTVDQFNNSFESLFKATKAKTVGTEGDTNLKAQFEAMQQRIKSSGNVPADVNRKILALTRMADGKIKNIFSDAQINAFNF